MISVAVWFYLFDSGTYSTSEKKIGTQIIIFLFYQSIFVNNGKNAVDIRLYEIVEDFHIDTVI